MKIKMVFAYDGTDFFGSQIQPEKRTVAGEILEALKLLNITPEKINLSGRTDRGVHASYQVADFALPEYWSDLDKLKECLNRALKPEIYIRTISRVDMSFHSRFSAKKRVYRYILSTKNFSPFLANYVHFVENIDFDRVKTAMKLLEGRHDFRFFQKERDINTERVIYKADIYRYRDFYILYFEANAFLRSQIRITVDFLLKINSAKLSEEELREQLKCIKQHSNTLAPAKALYLSRVKYLLH